MVIDREWKESCDHSTHIQLVDGVVQLLGILGLLLHLNKAKQADKRFPKSSLSFWVVCYINANFINRCFVECPNC